MKMKATHDTSIPLYMQVYNYVLEMIEGGKYNAGSKIPSQNQLAALCGVSQVTVRKGLEQLAADDIITTKHGTGSFVTYTRLPQQGFAGGSFTETCRQVNREPKTKILSKAIDVAGRRVAWGLGISAGEKVLQIQRLRLMDEQECILEYDYLDERFFSLLTIPLENNSLLGAISKLFGQKDFYFDDFFDICYASIEQAKILDCLPGIPLLRVSEIIRTRDKEIIYYNEQLIRTDRYRYAIASSAVRP